MLSWTAPVAEVGRPRSTAATLSAVENRRKPRRTASRPAYRRPVFWSFIRSSVSSVSPSLNF
jgi:hypothetical protein